MGQRRRSREIALQVLYELETTETEPEEAIRIFYELLDLESEDAEEEDACGLEAPLACRPFAEKLIRGVWLHMDELDRTITSASEHWRLERMSLVDRNILRMALFEMCHCQEIPHKVSINEAVDLGKTYGSEESGAFINGILDHILPAGEPEKEDDQ